MNFEGKVTVGIWGCGRLGGSMDLLFKELGCPEKYTVLKYDKFKKGKEYSYPEDVVKQSNFLFICLPTPMEDSGKIDLSYINNAMGFIYSIGGRKKEQLAVIRSTVVPGTCDHFSNIYPEMRIACMPEFLTEKGDFKEEVISAKRLVFGSKSVKDSKELYSLFNDLYGTNTDFIFLSRREAEMYKYACNVFLGMNALVANELSIICDTLGVKYNNIQKYFKYDKRIGSHTLVPGTDGFVGIGGKCLPKDMNAILELSKSYGFFPRILENALSFNDEIRKEKDWLHIPGAVSSCGFTNKRK